MLRLEILLCSCKRHHSTSNAEIRWLMFGQTMARYTYRAQSTTIFSLKKVNVMMCDQMIYLSSKCELVLAFWKQFGHITFTLPYQKQPHNITLHLPASKNQWALYHKARETFVNLQIVLRFLALLDKRLRANNRLQTNSTSNNSVYKIKNITRTHVCNRQINDVIKV